MSPLSSLFFHFFISRVLPPINFNPQLQLQLQPQHPSQNQPQKEEKKVVVHDPQEIGFEIKKHEIFTNKGIKAILQSLQKFEISLQNLKNLGNSDFSMKENEKDIDNENEKEGVIRTEKEVEKEIEKEVEDEAEDNASPSPAMQLILDILKR